jgi:hypothetical protein
MRSYGESKGGLIPSRRSFAASRSLSSFTSTIIFWGSCSVATRSQSCIQRSFVGPSIYANSFHPPLFIGFLESY